jgi:hypothetical protein
LSYIYHETLRNKLTIYKITQYPSLFYILSNLVKLASRNEPAWLGSLQQRAQKTGSARLASLELIFQQVADLTQHVQHHHLEPQWRRRSRGEDVDHALALLIRGLVRGSQDWGRGAWSRW